MNISNIKNKINSCLDLLDVKDMYLLQNNGSERAIAHRLAKYIESYFPSYHIDVEYNLNNDNESFRKKIELNEEDLMRYKISNNNRSQILYDDEVLFDVSVFPDIIIHKRGENQNNLLIIEVKKNTNTDGKGRKFDNHKLKYYTKKEDYNDFHYKYGLFLDIDCLNHTALRNHKQQYYINGEKST